MKKYLNILLIAICLASCGQTKTAIAILPYDEYKKWIFTNCKQAKLTNKDYKTIEVILRTCITDYNQRAERYFNEIKDENPEHKINKDDFFINLKKYKRQYIAIINEKGEKEVWINCFCANRFENWKSVVVVVDDGGNCFFNLKINLAEEKYYDFEENFNA